MPRKGENIYKRKDGRWEGRYIKYHDLNGKAVYGFIYRHSYGEAKQDLLMIKASKVKPVKCSREAFGDYLSYWLDNVKPTLKQSTFDSYSNYVHKHIKPHLGAIQVGRITIELLQKFINLKSKELSAKTILSLKSVLNLSLSKVEEQNFVVNPCKYLKLPRCSTNEMRVFTLPEQKELESVLEGCSDIGILICLYTGIRIGELCALKWVDINFNTSTLYIRKTMQRVKDDGGNNSKTKVIIDEPKSPASKRNIPIPSFLLEALRHHKNTSMNNDFVISIYNHFIEPRTYQYRFKTLLKTAGIDDANFHALRHTFATRALEIGFDVKTLSDILGHSNPNITLKRYAHSLDTHKRKAMDKLEQVYNAERI